MAIKGIKERIIAAAIAEFVTNGYSGARMQIIADKAGINKALLHYHYRSKQQLYEIVLQRQFGQLIDSLFELLESETDFDTWLKSLIRKYLREILTQPGFSRFVLWELSSNAKILPALFKQVLEAKGRDTHFIAQTIHKRLAAEALPDYDPLQFMLNVLSLCIYPGLAKPILEQVAGKEIFREQDFAAKREEEIFKLIKYGIYGNKDMGK